MSHICVVDTTFSRVNMGSIAEEALTRIFPNPIIVRVTVPGIKDVPVALRRIMDENSCDAGLSLGWVGPTLNDKLSYLAYSFALQILQLETKRPVIDVTIHEDEAEEHFLPQIARDRVEKHVENLYLLLNDPEELKQRAGQGLRQGYPHAGPLE